MAEHRWRHLAYALSLGVYCTSWTFYGAVGSAARDGWAYLPIFVGPALVFLLAPRFLEALVVAVRAEGATTISDFIGSRFGKSRSLAALVTITATLGIIPYIALQLRSVAGAFAIVTGTASDGAVMSVTSIVLAAFALLFGTRRYDAAGRNEGVVYATALESIIKIGAFAAIGALAVALIYAAPPARLEEGLAAFAVAFSPERVSGDLIVITLLAMAAIVCLPRQFYLTVIEARAPSDIRRARLPFVLYLAATGALVLPITLAGFTLLPASSPSDLYVLSLPMAAQSPALTLLAFLGGFSAATAMVVVETIALATMVSNDLITPVLMRSRRFAHSTNMGRNHLVIRRGSIMTIVGLALLWASGIASDQGLAPIGYIAFAAMAQFAPLLVLAVAAGDRDASAAKAGMSVGLALWLYTLALPPVVPTDWLTALEGTPMDPRNLLGLGLPSPLANGALWSVGSNLAVFAILSARSAPAPRRTAWFGAQEQGDVGDIGTLRRFVGRFIGEEAAGDAFGAIDPTQRIERSDAQLAERLIARVVGAPSARALMASALVGKRLNHDDVARMLDASGQSLQFSKGLLAQTIENIDSGVSVIDGNLRLAAWNSRYVELFGYPPGMVRVGAPIADLIRFNALRGECGPGEIDALVERRLAHLREGVPHSFERRRENGRVLKTVGGPMPGGGYVTCFTDVTSEANARSELEAARAELETRVAERTLELSAANEQLTAATRDKTRFLAAASHDLLQPLHAARLFSAALGRELGGNPLTDRLDQSIAAAESLLRALLDISKLDAGAITPDIKLLEVRPLLVEIVEGFRPLAAEKGLSLRLGRGTATTETDPGLLRSILHNFVSNAIRYTERGGVLIGVRPRGDRISIEVFDTGPGIPPEKRKAIFREFERLGTGGEAGAGLGLAIVDRSARLLHAPVTVDSVEGRGSVFRIDLPRAAARAHSAVPPRANAPRQVGGLRILVVDDDPSILAASQALLERSGHEVWTAIDADQAIDLAREVEVALVDFNLGAGADGLAAIDSLRSRFPDLRAALLTADGSPETAKRAAAANVTVLSKPLSAETLDAWLSEEGTLPPT